MRIKGVYALKALSSLRGLRGAPAVPPLCRETQSLGQQMLERWEKMGWINKIVRICDIHFYQFLNNKIFGTPIQFSRVLYQKYFARKVVQTCIKFPSSRHQRFRTEHLKNIRKENCQKLRLQKYSNKKPTTKNYNHEFTVTWRWIHITQSIEFTL